jgi:regulatory protein
LHGLSADIPAAVPGIPFRDDSWNFDPGICDNRIVDETFKLLMKKAGALLAKRAYSRIELQERLAGTAGDYSVEPVLDRLEQLNLLNDVEYAYNFALCRMKQEGWGPAKIRNALLRRHIQQRTIEAALQMVENELGSDIAIEQDIREYSRKKGVPADIKSLRRLFAHLAQKGFDEDSIQGVLRRVIPAKLWHRFETGESIE